jgi:folate-binding protein YgfZ
MINWQRIIQHFSGHLIENPAHLAPSHNINPPANNKNIGMCPLTNIGFISILGADSQKFLQGQLTCDIRDVTQFETKLSGQCNPKGRLHSIFQVIQLNTDNYCLALPMVQLAHVLAVLKKYAIFSKVKIEELPLYSFGVIGDKNDIGKISPKLIDLEINHKFDEIFNEINITYIRLPSHDPAIYRYISIFTSPEPSENIITTYWKTLNQLGFDSIDTLAWHKFNILAELPNIYPEATEKFLPHHLNLPELGAVSFKKGCYTGQEIIARMEYLGNIKKTILCCEFKSNNLPPAIGEALSDQPDLLLIDYVPLFQEQTYLGLFIKTISNTGL